MAENRHFSEDGTGRLFAAVEAAPFIDVETDEQLDLFVCDLLSDADKARLEERIGRNLYLAVEVERRKTAFDPHLSPEQLNKLTNKVLGAVPALVPAPSLTVVSGQFLPDQNRPLGDGTSVSRSGWKLPTWLLIAAAFVVLIGIAGVIVNRGKPKRENQRLALSNASSDPPLVMTKVATPAGQQNSAVSSPPFDATIATARVPMPSVHESPDVSSGPFDATLVLGKLPTPALKMNAALGSAPFDPIITATKRPAPAVQLSPARNNTSLDATVAMAKPPAPNARESPVRAKEPNAALMAVILGGVLAPLARELDDAPDDADEAAATRRYELAGIVAARARERDETYSVIGISGNDTLNIRSRPSEKASIVAKLRNGTPGIQVAGRTVMNGSDDWVRVTASGVKGWVRPKYLSPTRHVETADEKRRRLAGRLGIALALKLGTRLAAEDDSSETFVKVLGSWAADAIIESTVNEAFPDQPLMRQQVVKATKALFEGDLTLIAAREENQKQEMIAWLQRRSPSAAQDVEVIDFLYEVYRKGHS